MKKRKSRDQDGNTTATTSCLNRKKYSAKRWVVERTNSWHNRFRKLFTRYEKSRKTILDWYSYPVVLSSIEK